MDPVPFAARQVADELLLVGPLEIEAGDVRAGVELAAPHVERVVAAGNLLEDRVFAGSRASRILIDVAEFDRVADAKNALVGLFQAHDHAEQRRFADAVGADHADDAAGRQPEVQIFDQQPIAVAFEDVLGLDDQIAQVLAGQNLDFQLFLAWRRSARPTSFHRLRGGLCSWPAGRGEPCGPIPALCRAFFAGPRRPFPRVPGGPASAGARRCNSLPRGCPARDRVPESSRRRCPESSGRGSRRRRCPGSRPDAAPARPRFRRRDGSSVRRAAAGRAVRAGFCRGPRGAFRRPKACRFWNRPGADSSRPWRFRPGGRVPRRCADSIWS